MKRFYFPCFVILFSILNYVFHTQVDFLIVLDYILVFFFLIANSQLRKKSVCKKIMLKNCLKLFIVLVLPLYCVAYTTHKITIFMNHSKISWKLLGITSKIIFSNIFFADEVIKKRFEPFLDKCENEMETPINGNDLIYDCVNLLHCKCHKLNLRGLLFREKSSHKESSVWDS